MNCNCIWVAKYANGGTLAQAAGVAFDKISRSRLIEVSIYYKSRLILSISLNKGDVIVYRKRTFIHGSIYKAFHILYHVREDKNIYLVDDESGAYERARDFGAIDNLHEIKLTASDLVKVN